MTGGGQARERANEPRISEARLRGTRRGQIIADTYRLLEIVGTGGMAEVYAAEHTRLGRRFALKLVRADGGAKALARFRREARALARIESEFVVGVVDCGEMEDGAPYLVLDLLQGEDLRSLLDREGPLPIPRAVRLVWEACQGVAAVHAASLVHRDLKPENLFVAQRANGEDWCKVLDFGIAKTELSGSTAEGAVIGTVRYMAPEQLKDGASAGPSVDVYALGAVLYECLIGVSPHSAATIQELMFKIVNDVPAPLSEGARRIPAALADAVHRALARDPADRFSNVMAFARALEPFSRPGGALDRASVVSETVELEPRLAVQATAARSSARSQRTGLLLVAALASFVGFLVHGFLWPSAPAPRAAVVGPIPVPALVEVTHTQDPPPRPVPNQLQEPEHVTTPAPSASQVSVRRNAVPPRLPATSRPPAASPGTRFDVENPYAR